MLLVLQPRPISWLEPAAREGDRPPTGQLKVVGAGRQHRASPGGPLCLGCDDLLHNNVNVLFHLELTVSFAKKRTASVRGNRAGARMSTPTYESSRQTAKMNKERLAANHPAIWMKKQKGRPQSAKTWLASGN